MNFQQLRTHRRENHFQAAVLILGMAGIMSLAGYTLAGEQGVWFALAFSGFSALLSPSLSPKLVLQMHRARPIDPRQAPELYAMLGELVHRAELAHQPTLYRVPTGTLNAFAVGADRNAAIGLTDGLLRKLTRRELAGVLAHELSHLRSYDTRLMALGDVFTRLTATMSHIGQFLLLLSLPAILFGAPFISLGGLLVLLFAPLANTMLQLALSRSREFQADLGAIELTRDPAGMVSALDKLERAQWGWWRRLFQPFRVLEPNVLRTHPVTEERIDRIERLFGESNASRLPKWHYAGVPSSATPTIFGLNLFSANNLRRPA